MNTLIVVSVPIGLAALGAAAAIAGARRRATFDRRQTHTLRTVQRYIAAHQWCTAEQMITALEMGASYLYALLSHLEDTGYVISVHESGPNGGRRIYAAADPDQRRADHD